jgi:endogenous inhibitor of DNA gyrase (YacG/DUF329 family)
MKCPICDKETRSEGNPYRPFCSERCKLLDLGNWAGERYSVPTKEEPPEEIHRPNGTDED